nr:MAG TPA: hypothetical protein [Caudoviricetes sp.]
MLLIQPFPIVGIFLATTKTCQEQALSAFSRFLTGFPLLSILFPCRIGLNICLLFRYCIKFFFDLDFFVEIIFCFLSCRQPVDTP